jgi:hypothetical protein
MCRNIRILFNFEPPATEDEIHAAALQYVRKVSGATHPSKANEALFQEAVDRIAEVTALLVHGLRPPGARPPGGAHHGQRTSTLVPSMEAGSPTNSTGFMFALIVADHPSSAGSSSAVQFGGPTASSSSPRVRFGPVIRLNARPLTHISRDRLSCPDGPPPRGTTMRTTVTVGSGQKHGTPLAAVQEERHSGAEAESHRPCAEIRAVFPTWCARRQSRPDRLSSSPHSAGGATSITTSATGSGQAAEGASRSMLSVTVSATRNVPDTSMKMRAVGVLSSSGLAPS